MSYISNIHTAVPDFKYAQSALGELLYGETSAEMQRLSGSLFDQSGIDQRFSVLSPEELSFMTKENSLSLTTKERQDLFEAKVFSLTDQVWQGMIEEGVLPLQITHLITVTCTGISAPGLDVQLTERWKLNADVVRIGVNFMGCYAALQAMRLASWICNSEPAAVVLIVSVELCTLHFKQEKEHLLSSALFADGAGGCIMRSHSPENRILNSKNKTLNPTVQYLGSKAKLCPDEGKHMSWKIGSHGYDMVLTNKVAPLLEKEIFNTVDSLCDDFKVEKTKILNYAFHPGGKRILEGMSKALDLQKEDLQSSYQVMQQFGNMSSSTILYVLKDMIQQNKKGLTLAAAFGPGLTIETALWDIL